MEEYLDYYDENGNYLGKETRVKVHAGGLWHKTIHCWLYDDSNTGACLNLLSGKRSNDN